MYKRRKKPDPVANSTFKDNVPKAGSFTSSQSSVVSTISSQYRSDSPEDLFGLSQNTNENVPSTSSGGGLIHDVFNKPSSNGIKKSPIKDIKKNAASDVLKMLMSSDDSEPLSKVPKMNGTGTEKLVLSQTLGTGPLKFFHDTLSNAGLIIGRSGNPNYIKKSQAIFVRNLSRTLEKEKECKQLGRFIENLQEYLSETETLRSALSPTKNHPDVNLPGDSQDCLIRLLLSIDVIQSEVISFLLDKVAEYAVAGEEPGGEESLAMVRMILHSLRYLTKIGDPQTLTVKLFDIIHAVSTSMLKHEIINCLPDIISDTQREHTANELMELMKSEPYLSPSILFTLSNLWLDPDSLYQLQLNLIRTLKKTSTNQLPAFIRFITSGDINTHADEIINGLRSELAICQVDSSSTQTKSSSKSDVSSILFLIFEKLRDSVLKSKKLADIWLKNIGKVKSAAYHKPIDILMLLIIHCMSPDVTRKKAVEAVFKTKIKMGHFKEPLIEETLAVGLVIIKEYFVGLLKLLSSLLQAPDLSVSNFSAFFYTECFAHLDPQWRKMIILELKDNATTSKGNARPALNLIHTLTSKHVAKVAPYVTLIMLLLDSVGEMRIIEVRQLMDALCMIAFNCTDCGIDNDSIQDELVMIVQKQLSRPDPSIFRSGVISGIVIIKHMVKLKDNVPNETPSSEEEEITLGPMALKALNLFELVLMSTRSSAEAQVLVFDQLSFIVMTTDNMDKRFMKRISILMQSQLQNHFIIASSDFSSKDNGLEPALQFCIDTDFEDPIVFNLVDAVILEANSNQIIIPIVALPGLVRCVRGLEIADLSEIDALLGCAISFPSPSIYAKFGSADPNVQTLALDCLFHASNWLREMLNSFVFLIKEGAPEKILKRLRALVYLQNLISICLPQTVYPYSPPKCYFDYSSSGKLTSNADKAIKVPTAGRKKQKKKSKKDDKDENNDDNADENVDESDEEKEEELVSLEFSKFNQHFRELDFDVCLVLTQPLTLSPQPIKDGDCSAELGPSELLLLLDDLNSKLKFCLNTKRAFPGRKEPVGFDNLSTISLDLIIRNTAKLASTLTSHLQKIVEYLHNLVMVHDGIMDAPGMFAPGSHEIKQSLALIFSIFNTYLSWPDLESDAYSKCLIKCLIKLGGPNWLVEKKESVSLNSAIKAAMKYLSEISKCILDLTSAVGLVNLLKTLQVLQDENDKFELNLGELCEELLKRKWFDAKGGEAKGSVINQQQTILLDFYLTDEEHCLENIEKLLSWLTVEVETLGTDNSLTTFPHFNRSNLNVLIRSVCKALLFGAKIKLEGKDCKEKLQIWDIVVNGLQSLIGVIKIHDLRINLRQFLKGCLPILRFFLAQGMSVCSMMFKIESAAVIQTIKKLQVITRYIQSICNYSKLNKDNSLIQQLPGMRAILETLLLSVKNMILQNKCTDAFFMGSMRNKDIHGEIITSQNPEEMMDSSEELQPTTSNIQDNEVETGNESNESENSDNDDDDDDGAMSDTY